MHKEYADNDASHYGLYLEFTRFVNCEWPMHIALYNELKYNDKYQWKLFLRFEWFHDYDYKQSIDYVFNKQLQLSQQTELYNDLLKGDLDNVQQQALQKDGENSFKYQHITKDTYDKELQIKLLLTYDKRICNKIKEMTGIINDPWLYSKYC